MPHQSEAVRKQFAFRTKLPDRAPPPYCTRCDGFHGTEDCVGLEAEEPSPALAAVLLCRLVQLEAECDALRAQLAAFTAQNVPGQTKMARSRAYRRPDWFFRKHDENEPI